MHHIERFTGLAAIREALADLVTTRRMLAELRARHVYNPELEASLARESMRLALIVERGPS